ncbi:rifampin ADP-ribosylating transferase [Mucilaginibacter pineti]|uniref:Rifampin ADP-ribosylating transferase n=1 Tax=Mucilaginibacter pineti TaxID=1391627 RepID=A0A1G7JXP9_9SPHI|nr:rRNA adenine methyltransferase [Mucilaginibacter pineti]SDF29716.1 rifampin ADP-ribosylating transferase [Mucilaginibacter pineti]
MQFDPGNPINKLCAQGMLLEGEAKPAEAAALFLQAWEQAINPSEKFVAAHYMARHQASPEDKLQWDETALQFALQSDEPEIEHVYPSLYLNIAKCHEDLQDYVQANENYRLALHYAALLPDDGYSNMIRSGINSGLDRVNH